MHYQKAEEVATKLDSDSDNYVTLAFIYQQLCIYASGSNSEPIEHLLPLCENPSLDNTSRIVLYQALGNIYRSAADWHNAKCHLKKAIKLAKSSGHINRAMECKAELGRVYRSSGCHSKALKRQKKLLEFAYDRGDVLNLANACGYVGFTHYAMGENYYSEAVKYLYCKLELSRDELNDPAGYRWSLNNLGKVYLELKEHDLCMRLFTESSEIAKQLCNMLGLGTAYGNLGSTCRAIGKHDEAIKYHKLYLEIAEKNSDTGGIAIMQRELILDHLYMYKDEAVDSEKKVDFLDEARKHAFRALRTSLEIRSRLGQEDDLLKIGNYEHNQAKIYSLLLFILIQQGQFEAGLVISELGRAHALADRIRDKFKINSNFLRNVYGMIGSADQIKYSSISVILDKISKLIGGFRSHLLVYSILDDPLTKKTLLYTWHVQKVFNELLGINVVVRFRQSVMSVSQADGERSVIDENYVSGLMRDICIKTGAQLVTEPQKSDKNEALATESLSRDIVRRKNPLLPASESTQPKKSRLEELYDLLIAPMSQYIYLNNTEKLRLIIIPHGFLFNVPFCALKSQGKYLVENFVIAMSPSLYILDIGFQREEEWYKSPARTDEIQVLAVGNPKMPLSEIQQLPGAETEVNSIDSLLTTTRVLCGEEATKMEVIEGFSKYSVIHLATHAIVEASLSDHLNAAELNTKLDAYDVGDYSVKGAIILARSDPICSGVLTSSEIEKLKLDPTCELVILSCCNTARGKITGDGILGLSRSLMCAGVMNMMVTLWSIHDSSTPVLIKHFYNHYAINRDAPVALQFSMLRLIRQNYAVERWAPFSCIGIRYNSYY